MDNNNQGTIAFEKSENVLNVLIFIATLLMALPVIMESLKEKQILIVAKPRANKRYSLYCLMFVYKMFMFDILKKSIKLQLKKSLNQLIMNSE